MPKTSNTNGRASAHPTRVSKPLPASRAPRRATAPLAKAAQPRTARPVLPPAQVPAQTLVRQTRRQQTAAAAAAPPQATEAPTPGNKQLQVVSMLRRPQGATVAELMAITGWMAHSVRGLFSAVVKRKLGLDLTSAVEQERGRVYRLPGETLVPPTAPLPARRRKAGRVTGQPATSMANAAG